MRFLKFLSLALTLFGCRDPLLSQASGELLVEPGRLNFGRAWVGLRSTQGLDLQNTSRQALEVSLSVGAPFDVVRSVRIAGGERVAVVLGVVPLRSGALGDTLLVSWNGNTREVPVEADAESPPPCPERDCRTFTFDPGTANCLETVLADGAGCGASNQCLTGGTCRAGTCVGQARDCNDADACTTDACDVATGCVHDAVACPGSDNPCEVPLCTATGGCGLTPALDGASCGSNDCVTAHVCITGQCVTRAAPDGSQCAAPTVCRGTGLCRAQVCEKPAPTPLQPRWRYTPEPGHDVVFLGHVDEQGNLYATETWTGPAQARATDPAPRAAIPGAASDVAGVPRQRPPDGPVAAILSLTPSGVVRFREPVVFGCSACAWGLGFSVDSAGHRLFFNALGQTQARSTDDGRLLWKVDATAGLPALDVRADGGAVFSTSPPLLVGDDVVGVPVLEGEDDHHSYVQGFDRATGVARWQFHRKGHLYGAGVAASGELWTSSANCWAVAGEMVRLAPLTGLPRAQKFVEWIPSLYGDDFALGTASGALHRLDGALDLHSLSTLTTASAGASMLVTGPHLVLWDAPVRALHSVNLTSGVTAFTFHGVTGTAPDFELLRNGGVAWTSPSTDGGVLGAVDGRGEELLQCPILTSVDSPTALVRGRAYLQAEGSLVGFEVPGLDVAPHGWVSRGGSLARGGRAR